MHNTNLIISVSMYYTYSLFICNYVMFKNLPMNVGIQLSFSHFLWE